MFPFFPVRSGGVTLILLFCPPTPPQVFIWPELARASGCPHRWKRQPSLNRASQDLPSFWEMNLPQVKGTHEIVEERSPLSTHPTGPVAPTSTGSASLLYVEIGLKGFALEFNSLLALPGLL